MTSYDMVAVEAEDHYRVTVIPKHGKAVTLYAVQAVPGEEIQPRRFARRTWHKNEKGEWRYGYDYTAPKTLPGFYDVKTSLTSNGYITRHRSLTEAAIAANRRARRYGRMCSKPIRKAS